jgi:hypothetical protein
MHMATPVEDRPPVTEVVHTADLPAGPQRDSMIPATLWVEAPPELLALGIDLGHDLAAYIRRIGRFLLWRSGPAVGADSRYLALAADDLTEQYTYRLFPDGSGEGEGPDGMPQIRFRTWKESLRDG